MGVIMIETRNKKAIRKIAWRYMKSSKQRNVFIVLAVALSAFLLSAVFSLGITFYNANSRQQVIAEGTKLRVQVRGNWKGFRGLRDRERVQGRGYRSDTGCRACSHGTSESKSSA